jgi:non-ribosomal peptide synthase protein (TIGR01720 family)
VDAADPLEIVIGCLAAWRAGVTPWVGPGGSARLAMRPSDGTVRRSARATVYRDEALVVAEPLVGCIAHPAEWLGGLPLLDPVPAAVRVLADWRVDAWLPLVIAALLAGVPHIELLPAGSDRGGAGGGLLAFPGHLCPAGAESFDGWVTWGATRPTGLLPARHAHGFGDHFVLASITAELSAAGQGPRGTVRGRHRVLSASGRPIPDNAWGLLGLAGWLPIVTDTPEELAAAPAQRDRRWVTDLRARRRSDGTIEFDLTQTDPLRFAGRRLAPLLVRRALAAAGVPEAVLLAREPHTRRARLVLYLPEGTNTPVATARLAATLPEWARPLGGATIGSIPYDDTGEADWAALTHLAPPDDWLLKEAERSLADAHGSAVQLRVRPVPVTPPAVPLPAEFEVGGWHYPAAELAELAGPSTEPPDDTLADRLRHAASTDSGILMVDSTGAERELSYRELLHDAARMASYLRAQGLGAGDELIVHCQDPADLFGGIWACVLAGVLAVPITPASPYDAPGNPMWHLLGPDTMLTRTVVLTTSEQAMDTAAALAERGLRARLLLIDDARGHDPLPDSDWTPGTHAFLLLTSGSTGAPKGVPLSHRNLVSLADAVGSEFAFGAETSLNWLAVDHVGGLVQHHVRDLCLANRQIHVDTSYILAKPTRMLDLLDRHHATLAWQANFGFTMLNERAAEISEGSWDLSAVKLWENGGEAVTHDSNQRFLTLLAPHGLRPDVVKPVFGMTETSSAVIASHALIRGRHDNVHWLADTSLDHPVVRTLPGNGGSFVEVGKPMKGIAVRVVDAAGQTCPEGVTGRIEVSGPQVFDGYYRNPEATAEAFTTDGWLRMGDCGFMAGGNLVVTGREKDIIIVNGRNVAARALENAIEAVPAVRAGCCAAISVRRPEAVTDDLVVFFSSAAGTTADPAAIEAALLAEFGLRPIALLELDPEQWPRTAIGKIRKPPLAQGFLAGELAGQIVSSGASGLGERAALPAFHFAPYWRPMARPPRADRRLLWLGGPAPADAPLAAVEGEDFEGFDAAGRGRYRPGHEADLAALLAEAAQRLGGPGTVVETSMRGAADDAGDPSQDAVRALAEAHARWDALCRAAARQEEPPVLIFATDAACTVTGDESAITRGALPGIAESLGQSYPRLSVKMVDGASDADLLAEQGPAPGTTRIAYRNGVRMAMALRPLPARGVPATPGRVLKENGHYLVIGGLGGIGVLLCQHLLRNFAARLVVVGRGAAEPGGSRAQLLDYLVGQAAARSGARIDYRVADATDPAALEAVVKSAEHGAQAPFDAVFTLLGEGTVAEQMRMLTSPDEAAQQLALERAASRIRLCHSLDAALAATRPPVVAFSSVNGFFGGAGFAHYAGACAYQAAHALRSDHGYVCLDWSMWQQVGMASDAPDALAELAGRRGFARMSPAQGLAALHIALEAPDRRVLIGLLADGSAVAPLLPAELFDYVVQADGVDDPGEVAAHLDIPASRVRCVRRASHDGRAISAADQEALLDVVRGVLAVSDLTPDDNFFAVGGDSIRAIQVVARAAERGIQFSALDLFEHKSVAALLTHLAENGQLPALAEDDVDVDVVEPVSLPPIFRWWLETADRPALRRDLTMSMRYDVDHRINPARVEAALAELARRHDALRLRLIDTPVGVRLTETQDVAQSVAFETHELDADEGIAAAAIAEVESRLHRSLDPGTGPILRAALLRGRSRACALLLVVIHHAAADGVSWRIIEDDLAFLLNRDVGGAPPAPALGFLGWARRLARRARTVDGAALADAWLARLGQSWARLPAPAERPAEGASAVLTRTLSFPVPHRADIGVNEVLLTAVGWSLASWTGTDTVVVDIEGHGRLERDMPVDLSRTVGWFTAIAPLALDLRGCASPAEALPRVHRAVSDIRGCHLEWGMLRYLGACPAGHPLQDVPERQVSFNYLGVFDAQDEVRGPLSAVPGSLGAWQGPDTPRRYLIDIAAQLSGGYLELAVKYTPAIHDRAQVEHWLDTCVAVATGLLAAEPEPVNLAGLDQDEMLLALEQVTFGASS